MTRSPETFIFPSEEFRAVCERMDGYLSSLTASDEYMDLSSEHEEILQLAFVARAVLRDLVTPSDEVIDLIAKAEVEIKSLVDEYGEDDEDNEDDEDDEE